MFYTNLISHRCEPLIESRMEGLINPNLNVVGPYRYLKVRNLVRVPYRKAIHLVTTQVRENHNNNIQHKKYTIYFSLRAVVPPHYPTFDEWTKPVCFIFFLLSLNLSYHSHSALLFDPLMAMWSNTASLQLTHMR